MAMAMTMTMSIQLFLSPSSSPHPPPKPLQNPNITITTLTTRRLLLLATTTTTTTSLSSLFFQYPFPISSAEPSPSSSSSVSSSLLSGIANTKSWFQFYGDGFAIRIPPQFQDIMEPEDYSAGQSLYGDKVKPKTFAARFASPDGSEVVSVITRPTNQLKITFLEPQEAAIISRLPTAQSIHRSFIVEIKELIALSRTKSGEGRKKVDINNAQDITDLGSLKEAAKIFVPGGSTLYSARTIKIKEDEGFRTYYFYEFGRDKQHIALVAAVNGGKAFIAGATAPQYKWNDDGVKLRSAAVSLTVL